MICPKCGSKNVKETTAYAWSATCRDCGWFTTDYKTGPITGGKDMENTNEKMRAVVYTRSSSERMEKLRLEYIRKWMNDRGDMKEVMQYSDISSTSKRKMMFDDLENRLKEDRLDVDALVVYGLDELISDMTAARDLQIECQILGLRLFVVSDEAINLETSEGLLMLTFKSYAIEEYHRGLSEKVKAGLERKKAESIE